MSWVSKKLKYIELNGPSDKELKDIEADYGLQESVNDLMLAENDDLLDENDDDLDLQLIADIPIIGPSEW